MLDLGERDRLVQPYQPVSPAWVALGWALLYLFAGTATAAVWYLAGFSDRVDFVVGSVGVLFAILALGCIGRAIIAQRSFRDEMDRPIEAQPVEPADSSSQIGISRPARAT